jgi:putative ABC transport system permease protein
VSGARFVLAMAWRESRASRRRLFLLVLAVAVGVSALVAINSFTDNLHASVRAQARELLGADLSLASGQKFSAKTEDLLKDLERAAREAGGGRAVETARTTSFGAMAFFPGTAGTRLVQVTAVEPGYPYYGRIETEPAGEWERLEETGGALVDPSLLATLGAETGDTLALGEARLPVRGTVVNVPGDVGVRAAFGPRVFIPAARLAETELLLRGSRARYEVLFKLPPGASAQRLADRFRSRFQAERASLRTVAEDQDRMNRTLSRLANYLGLVALIALLLGGLGVASAVHVFIKRKLESVAVLRCLGASARTVFAVYLAQAAVVGLLGSLLGAAAGVVVQLALPPLLRDLLPVDVVYAPSPTAIAGGVALGLWVALVFALLPLLALRRVSPLQALRRPYEEEPRPSRDAAQLLAVLALVASVVSLAILQAGAVRPGLAFAGGIGVAILALWLAAFALTRGLRRFFPTRLPYLWRQGLANLYRPANQTLLVVLALGFGAFLLGTLLLVQQNLLRDLRVDSFAERPNLALFDIQGDQRTSVEQALRDEGLPVRPFVPVVPMRIQSVNGATASQLLAGVLSEEKARGKWALRREYRSSHRDLPTASEKLVAGEWWRPGEWKGRTDGPVPVALDNGVARELGVGIGDEIVWDVQGLAVPSRVAVLRDVDWARFEANFFVVFPEGPLDGAPQSYVALTRLDDPVRRGLLQRRLVEAHPNVSALDLAQVSRALETIVDRVALAIRFMALFSLGAGVVVLVGAVAASRSQRVREGALLRTIGASRHQLLRILFAEYASLGLIASATALVLAAGASYGLVRLTFDTRFILPVGALAALGALVVVLTVAVGLFGSTEVFRRAPLEVLRAE